MFLCKFQKLTICEQSLTNNDNLLVIIPCRRADARAMMSAVPYPPGGRAASVCAAVAE